MYTIIIPGHYQNSNLAPWLIRCVSKVINTFFLKIIGIGIIDIILRYSEWCENVVKLLAFLKSNPYFWLHNSDIFPIFNTVIISSCTIYREAKLNWIINYCPKYYVFNIRTSCKIKKKINNFTLNYSLSNNLLWMWSLR